MDVVTLGVVVEERRRIGPKRFELCPLSLTMDMRDASGQDGVEQGPRSSLANIGLIGPARADSWLGLRYPALWGSRLGFWHGPPRNCRVICLPLFLLPLPLVIFFFSSNLALLLPPLKFISLRYKHNSRSSQRSNLLRPSDPRSRSRLTSSRHLRHQRSHV
jgi:hypothetical protein